MENTREILNNAVDWEDELELGYEERMVDTFLVELEETTSPRGLMEDIKALIF